MKQVSIEQKRIIFEDVFNIEEAHLRYEKFDGRMSEAVRRISLERGDSVAVLILNLDTNKLIMVNQFRYPSYKNGHGWITETVAGILDPGETPEQTARREVEEEIGLSVSKLEYIANFYPSPGGSSERVYLFYSEVSGHEARYRGTGGLLSEGEDTIAVELSLEEAVDKIKSGEIMDAKTIIGIYWLENQRAKRANP
ncbi:MAG: NUDIX hydrolase [Chloroflexi bacterium]|nr:NUDIX hydrolase [Chloroflexota bacterium]